MSKAASLVSEEERRDDEDSASALTKKLSRVLVGTDSDSEDQERALREAVCSVRAERPGLVAKQVHAALLERGEQWASTTLSEVKRMCSKLAKVEVQLNLSQAGSGAPAEQLDKVLSDPLTRNAEAMKVARPGLPTNSTTLQRGDRLGTAAERGDTQQVVKLLKKGVDPNYQNGASGVTPLGVACERGHAPVVRALLLAGASPEISTREGYRPIHIASQFGRRDCIALLVNPGNADVNARCPLQDTFPLLLAANFNHTECVQLLLDAKADATMRTQRSGLNALHYACSDVVAGCLRDAGASTGASVGEDGKRVNTAMLDSSAQALRAEEAAARSKWGSMLQQHAADAGGSASAAVALAAGAATKSSAAVRSQANRATAGGCTAEDLAEGLSTADDHYEVD